MADELANPLGPDELFDYRGGSDGESPPLYHPYFQGDIFSGVTLPGVVKGSDCTAMIFMHPCTMRRGAVLKPEITMIEVSPADNLFVKRPERWQTYYSGMRVTGFDGTSTESAANFLHIATVSSSELHRSKRVATLSVDGRLQFQQRIIYHLTRFAPDLAILQEATLAVDLELELQAEWMRGHFASQSIDDDLILTKEKEFDAYMAQPPTFNQLLSGAAVPNGDRRSLLRLASSELRRELAHTLPD